MQQTFQLPLMGEITIEGREEDLNSFFTLTRIAFRDAIAYNRDYANCLSWADVLEVAHDSLPDPSLYADPTLDLPF